MQMRLLRHFLGVADRGNITAAAQALNISQPALSKSIRQLEREVGALLFERHLHGVALTREGEVLARRARLMELEFRHALAEISAMEHGLSGVLRVEAGPVWLTTMLPPVVAAFHHQFPRVKVRLTGGVIDTMVPSLIRGDIDVICGTLDFPNHPEFVKEPLIGIRHVVIASRRHPLLKSAGPVSAQALTAFPWIVAANDHVGISRIGSYFAANGLTPPNIVIETTSIPMLKILGHGDFLAHVPEQMLQDAARFDVVKVPHEGTFWDSPAGIAYRLTRQPVRMIESFKAILQASLSQSEPR